MLYHLGTLLQIAIGVTALAIIVQNLTEHGRISLWRALVLVGLALNETHWTLARLVFADAWPALNGFVELAAGMDAKLWFETTSSVVLYKALIAAGLIGMFKTRLMAYEPHRGNVQ